VIAIDCDKAAFEGEEQQRLIAEHKDRLIPVQGTHTHTHRRTRTRTAAHARA
jgi:hypothetical protein